MLLAFQIRASYFGSSSTTPAPTVYLDPEDGSLAVMADARTVDEDPRVRITRQIHLADEAIVSTIHPTLPTGALSANASSKTPDFLSIPSLPWSFLDDLAPSRHIHRVYPLRLSFHQDLRSLTLTNDGSSLFQKASDESIFITPSFSETNPSVEFSLQVETQTGCLIKAVCLRELFDKRLQHLAQQIVDSLRFAPLPGHKDSTISGVMTLQFSGTYDTIGPFVEESS